MADLTERTVVISQSMYFPWVGLLEQVRLADIFVHYDDVQFARGFYNRVQIKTAHGIRWLTVPTRDRHRGQRIDEVRIDEREDWRAAHRNHLVDAYRQAPFLDEVLSVVDAVFAEPAASLADVSRQSILTLAAYFGLDRDTRFLSSNEMDILGASSQRLLDLTAAVGGTVYLTGHGARKYLDHKLFERSGIDVLYMDYACTPYPQLHGKFTPYVTSLDLIANCGPAGVNVISSGPINWKDFINGSD